jgi:hypothetical protein
MALVRDPSGPETFVSNEMGDGKTTVVNSITLDSFLADQNWPRVDVVKMNIEGSEGAAIKGMREVARRNPTLKLVMEFNPTALARAGFTRSTMQGALAELGFRRGQIVERGLRVVPDGWLLPKGGDVYNILLTQ